MQWRDLNFADAAPAITARKGKGGRSSVVSAHSELVDAFRSVPRGRADDRYSNFLTGPRPGGSRRKATASATAAPATGCKAA